ncbi:HAMP domain-containing sensor histidine kinase [Methylopila sp. M107]|uniref:sensor histidine kinase n=1 Tax=Methylopila sp. M107 TaxID=1101190 RepID=UPI00036B9A63|nr:HAMP domain-containing sensor histidine kinase [Methylopila sp. M107]
MTRFWSRSLTVQFVALMLLALAVSQGVGLVVAGLERSALLQNQIKSEFISRAASVAQLLDTTPPGARSDILRASGANYSRFWVTPGAPPAVGDWRRDAFGQLTQPLPSLASLGSPEKFAGAKPDAALVAAATAPTKDDWSELSANAWPLDRPAKFVHLDDAFGMGLAVRLNDGSWLNTVFAKPAAIALWNRASLVTLALTALLLTAIAAFITRGITKPMRRMAEAAESVGRGEAATLPETGPDDIRQTAVAFNQMQARLGRFVDDRTRMLAAIGHDLRTPITSLRLRAEFVADDETREKMLGTIDELRSMTEAGLAFAREEAASEDVRAVDVSALVESLCDDLAELGQDVAFAEGATVRLRCRPDALRRAVRNLVENAVRYGAQARVRVVETPASVDIVVEDDGPGVPTDAMEQVFAPFHRLETSRSRETGGIGLGLSIARTIARRHGGDVSLENLPKGLRATISLPRPRAVEATARAGRVFPGLPRQKPAPSAS